MKPTIIGNWHFWESNGKILASNEDLKRLYSFSSLDNCITWMTAHNLGVARRLWAAVKT